MPGSGSHRRARRPEGSGAIGSVVWYAVFRTRRRPNLARDLGVTGNVQRTWNYGAWIAAAATLVAAALAFLLFVPTGEYVILPGITQNLNRIVTVSGARPPRRGRLLMVAVTVEPSNWYRILAARWQPAEELLPKGELFPPNMSFSQYVNLSFLQMQQSHVAAKAAAFRALGLSVRMLAPKVYVAATVPNEPADGRLDVMDQIVSFDGHRVTGALALTHLVEAVKPGSDVTIGVIRHGKNLVVHLRTAKSPFNPKESFLGVELTQLVPYRFPRQVTIRTSEIGGPSAGMMFAIEIIAQVHPESALPGGRVIAGTGEITPSGRVLPIGGAGEKVVTAYDSGARLFLVPQANYASAVRVRNALNLPVRVVPVKTLDQALAAIGYQLPGHRVG